MLLLIKYTLLYGIVLMMVALGGMFSEHSGIINIALEGIMVIGGVAGVLTLTLLPAGRRHGFGECGAVNIDFVGATLFYVSTASVMTLSSEAVGVVYQKTEVVFLFQISNAFYLTLHAAHAENAFGDNEYAATQLFSFFCGNLEFLLAIGDIVVTEFDTGSIGHTYAVDNGGMAVCIVNHYVVAVQQAVDSGHNTLVAVVDKATVFLVGEIGQFCFELFMPFGLAGHNACTHGVCHAVFGGRFRVGFAYFGMVGQTEVVVQAPAEDFPSLEHHVRTYFPFEFREHIIAFGLVVPHFQRARLAFDFVE